MKALPDFKRGDSFTLACVYKLDGVPTPVTGMTIASQIRTISGDLIAGLTYTMANQALYPGAFTLSAAASETVASFRWEEFFA